MNETQKTGMQNGSQMRISLEERELIKRTFGGNEAILKLIRKIFLPEIDPTAPIGQVIDLWLSCESVTKGQSMEEKIVQYEARNLLIKHVDQQLMTLKLISEMPDDGARAVVKPENSTQ